MTVSTSSSSVQLISHTASPLKGTAIIPGDKSISHRALMLGAINVGSTRVHGLLEGEDVLSTAEALRELGASIRKEPGNVWVVEGVGVGGFTESSTVLDMGNSGTSTRLLMGLVATQPITTFFTGDASLRKRPMQRVTGPLERMGARCITRDGGRLPLTVIGSAAPVPISYKLPVPSAQVKSAILLAGLNTPGITEIIETAPTRDHTERMLHHFGVEIETTPLEDGGRRIRLQGQPEISNPDVELVVPADPSSAAFLTVAALIVPGSSITLPNICLNPSRTGLYTTLQEMGADITFTNRRNVAGEEVADIVVKHSKLSGVSVPAERAPSMIDEYPILAIAAACAEGATSMYGLSELRVKESDRLAAIAEGLEACGVEIKANSDSLIVRSKGETPKGGATIKTHMDHRIAMSFLTLGMVSKYPITIDDGRAIDTSFPGFTTLCNELGASIERSVVAVSPAKKTAGQHPLVIAIDGPAASGKGTLARRLADHFQLAYLDTGALYRAVGLRLAYSGQSPENRDAAIEAAKAVTPDDLANPRLRQEHIGQTASIVSAIPEVRDALLDFQRRFAQRPEGVVLDGRDIGTVVCPDAPLKLFITASMEARARRRHKELQGQGIEVVYESVLRELKDRDRRDAERSIAPLKPADDAIHIDTTNMDAEMVLQRVLTFIDEAQFTADKTKAAHTA